MFDTLSDVSQPTHTHTHMHMNTPTQTYTVHTHTHLHLGIHLGIYIYNLCVCVLLCMYLFLYMYRKIDACARVAALAGKRVVAGPKDLVHLHNKLSQILRVLEEADSRGFISRGK